MTDYDPTIPTSEDHISQGWYNDKWAKEQEYQEWITSGEVEFYPNDYRRLCAEWESAITNMQDALSGVQARMVSLSPHDPIRRIANALPEGDTIEQQLRIKYEVLCQMRQLIDQATLTGEVIIKEQLLEERLD